MPPISLSLSIEQAVVRPVVVVMASGGEVQESLQAVAQGLRWTYALLWHLCPDQGYSIYKATANFF